MNPIRFRSVVLALLPVKFLVAGNSVFRRRSVSWSISPVVPFCCGGAVLYRDRCRRTKHRPDRDRGASPSLSAPPPSLVSAISGCLLHFSLKIVVERMFLEDLACVEILLSF